MLQWETLGDQVANSVNNQPIAIGNPNRLMLGRKNDRSPTGNLVTTNDPRKIIRANNETFNTWFECWLISYIPCYIPMLIHQNPNGLILIVM